MPSAIQPDPRRVLWGSLTGAFDRLGSLLWSQTLGRSVRRALPVPAGVRVVAIGGATLGGSGKTPLSIACAEYLATLGLRVAIVGHAYRATPGRARVVSPTDRLKEVGDEALLAARIFARARAPRPQVVVAPSRALAMEWAAREADVLVLDGVAQTAPEAATLALLALDGTHPWGRARALPPRGDLRAPVSSLVAACDALVPICDDGAAHSPSQPERDASTEHAGTITEDPWLRFGEGGREPFDDPLALARKTVFTARAQSRGAWDEGGTLHTWEALRSVRVGLLTAIARPERVIAALARRGVHPRVVLIGRDHGPIPPGAAIEERGGRGRHIDLWLATGKCALHAEQANLALPLATVDYSVMLPRSLCDRLATDLRPVSRARADLPTLGVP